MKSFLIIIFLIVFPALIMASNDSIPIRTNYILFNGKGNGAGILTDSVPFQTHEAPSSAPAVTTGTAAGKSPVTSTGNDSAKEEPVIKHSYEILIPDTLIAAEEPVKRKVPEEEWYVKAGKMLLLVLISAAAVIAGFTALGGLLLIFFGILALSTGSSAAALGVLFILGGLTNIALGLGILFGLKNLVKLPFFDSVIKRRTPGKSRKEEKPQIFN